MLDTGESLCNTNICRAKMKCTATITAHLSHALLCAQINNIKKMKRGREGSTVCPGAGKLAAFTPQNSCRVDGAHKGGKRDLESLGDTAKFTQLRGLFTS